jgi:hypothetical protein
VVLGAIRARVARPLVGDRLRRQAQRDLEELRHLAGALARQAGVVAVDPRERLGQRLGVGVADQVEADVAPVPHAFEHGAQPLDVVGWNLGDAGFEADRRYHVAELDGLELLGDDLAGFDPVAGLGAEAVRILGPLPEVQVARQVALYGGAALRLGELELQPGLGRGRRTSQDESEREDACLHFAHLPRARVETACSAGAPRRQNTSCSTVSS